MNKYNELILKIWREACRHIYIDESLSLIFNILREQLPVQSMSLYSIAPDYLQIERLCLVTLGAEFKGNLNFTLSESTFRALESWFYSEEVFCFEHDNPPLDILENLVRNMQGTILGIPLKSEHNTLGLLFLESSTSFNQSHERLAKLFCDPMTAALENDRRLTELDALREAAEADKRKLLARLGRDDVSDTIIGADRGLKAVLERVNLIARSDVPVLILGETGSGKEVIARTIHERSPQSIGPFIRVNCGAIPSELIDSELFGHEKGSFTGAVNERRGWFERAHGGTLFLDEIGELSPGAQIRLLRVIQEGCFERVGGEKSIQVKVRIVTATHRDLARMVQENHFREDLWYRVAVFPIVLPPLRERMEDIPALAEHFARRAARRFGLKLQLPKQEDILLLLQYRWPGNVREFASVIDRAAILGDGERLEIAKSLGITPDYGEESITRPIMSPSDDVEKHLVPLDQLIRKHIIKSLIACRGKIEGPGGAAIMLEINPHTLRAKMRKLNIDWKTYRTGGIIPDEQVIS